MGRIILFFLSSALFLSGCKNSKHAARGNEENGYMTGGNWTGLYYDHEAYRQHRKRQEELKKAKAAIAEFKSLLHRAEHGNPRAGYELARCYELGVGVEQNDSLAVKWYRLAAEAGEVISQLDLGTYYYNGDCDLDVDWLRLAARQGYEPAQGLLRINKQTW